ncbi:MAG: dockerin type I repeat-containing protein [Oscillospiraceae bacterium]|nr:dockerin type I repeat-containing protein [Oscillospiraceae bacterium]
MNRMMKKIAAALLAITCIPVTGLTASAEELPWYWGTTSLEAVKDLERVDDHGMLTANDYTDETHELYLYETQYGHRWALVVTPRTDVIRFVVREDVEIEEASRQVAEVIDAYYPGCLANYNAERHESKVENNEGNDYTYFSHLGWTYHGEQYDRVFELHADDNSAEKEAGILLGLAQRHLISEFYGWGQTAHYNMGDLPHNSFLGGYEPVKYTDGNASAIDWDSIGNYLTERHPGLTVETYAVYEGKEIHYRIGGAEDLSFREQFDLAVELWERFGIEPNIGWLQTSESLLTGGNALLKAGDVTLDTDITIVDVIALNRNIMTGDPLCETAKLNADLNGNGTPDETDSLNLLKYIVGINETLEDV